MKKKNGFISSAVVFTFFFVFLTMLLYIVSDFADTRILLNAVKNEIKEEVSNDTFTRYLVSLYNKREILDMVNLSNSGSSYEAKDNSYRYVGSAPNNYVCFGSDATNCPANNLYRIIGIIDGKIKLIKDSQMDNKVWGNSLNSNKWFDSPLLTDLNTIAGSSLTSLGITGENYLNLIEDTTWYVGGFASSYLTNHLNKIYDYEVGENKTLDTVGPYKIGLMYVSDYAYATLSNNWSFSPYSYNSSDVRQNNWLYLSRGEWTISRVSDIDEKVYYITSEGDVSSSITVNTSGAIRPVFYLKAYTRRTGGTGTSTDPYRVG